MSVVKDLIEESIATRLQENGVIFIEIESLQKRVDSYINQAEKNNVEIEELVDALDLENDHIERAAT